jgi:uncharacterized tellurite resistance protein B-like protein
MKMAVPHIDHKNHFLSETAARRAELLANVDLAAERLASRQAIAESVGTADRDIVDRIEQLGLSGDSARILDVLPLIHVAWADGRVQKEERAAVLAVLERRGISPNSDACLLVEALLEKRPSETFLAQSLALVRDLAGRSGAETADIVDLCARVAEASGGLFGFGARTNDQERALIGEVAKALGETAQERFRARFGG